MTAARPPRGQDDIDALDAWKDNIAVTKSARHVLAEMAKELLRPSHERGRRLVSVHVIRGEFARLVAAHKDCVGVHAEMTPTRVETNGGATWRPQIVIRVLGKTPVPCQHAFDGIVRQLQSRFDFAG